MIVYRNIVRVYSLFLTVITIIELIDRALTYNYIIIIIHCAVIVDWVMSQQL